MQKMQKDRINPPYVYLLTIGKICPHFLSNTKSVSGKLFGSLWVG